MLHLSAEMTCDAEEPDVGKHKCLHGENECLDRCEAYRGAMPYPTVLNVCKKTCRSMVSSPPCLPSSLLNRVND